MPTDRPIKLQLFETIHVRSAWDDSDEKWWLSALDVMAALTDQADYTKARNYWKWLKNKLKLEGSEVVSVTHQLKMEKQVRIATILDKFDALTHSLTEGLPREIALRQQQYEHCRNLLLSFPKPQEVLA
jgi:cell filamentation protein